MKRYLFLFFILYNHLLALGEDRRALEYRVLSDVKSNNVEKGYCLIIGTVYAGYNNSENTPVVENAVVSTINHLNRAVTDKKGAYKLLVPTDSVQLYFFKPYYKEIVTTGYNFKDQHIVEIDFYAREDETERLVKKPVIYLYPEKEQEIFVELFPVGELTFTYPEYKNGWKVVAQPDGSLQDESGKHYPYLFWEARQKELNFIRLEKGMPGFIVKNEEVISFLEEKLNSIGLNDKESTDFITFWGPILKKKEYAFVQFLLDAEYEKIGGIKTVPALESIRRVYILCSGLDSLEEAPDVIPQEFSPFERNGSVLVEWGGSEISIMEIVN